MNTEKLLKYITNPRSLNLESLDEMQKLVEHFPYSQNIQLLYLFNLSNTQDIRFGEQLQKTATYAADRRLLKKQIEELKTPLVSTPIDIELQEEAIVEQEVEVLETVQTSQPEKVLEDEVFDSEDVDMPVIIPSSSNSEKLKYDKNPEAKPNEELISERDKIRSKAELLQLVKKRLSAIEDEKDKNRTEKNIHKEEESPLQNKLDLIDKFIRVEPSISRPEKIAFFDPDVAAQESLFEDGAFVTETLAKIYYDQGNYLKAKEIYQILSLNNPEKSAYFAALIQELKNKIN
jgi:hypothetical protein